MIIMPEGTTARWVNKINKPALKSFEIISDTLRCVGASQETTVKERVAFLRMAEEGEACGVSCAKVHQCLQTLLLTMCLNVFYFDMFNVFSGLKLYPS